MVSLSITMNRMPTKIVTSRERIAPGLTCRVSIPQLARPAGRRRQTAGGRAPEKMPERDPHQDGDDERPARKRVHRLAEIVTDRLVTGEERPGLEDHQQEDRTDERRHQK